MDELLHNWEKKSAGRQKEYRRFLEKAAKAPVRNAVLERLPELHEEAFRRIDCLQCANCCKNFSPRFKTPDIKRIAKHLKMRESEFIEDPSSLRGGAAVEIGQSRFPFPCEAQNGLARVRGRGRAVEQASVL